MRILTPFLFFSVFNLSIKAEEYDKITDEFKQTPQCKKKVFDEYIRRYEKCTRSSESDDKIEGSFQYCQETYEPEYTSAIKKCLLKESKSDATNE